ncbi:MAG TPA: sigma-54 dependent transcriptional regulator [Vicinamibacterales bacterium]
MKAPKRVLIVDDEPDTAAFLAGLLETHGYTTRSAERGESALAVLHEWSPEIVLLDLMLPDADGLDVLQRIKESTSEVQVIMVTGYGSVPSAVEAMNRGAFTFIEKPIHAPLLLAQTEKAWEKYALTAENRQLRQELEEQSTFLDLVARSPKMKQLFGLIEKVAPSDASVLICGENGTGKELVASAIHRLSRRAKGPLVTVNCGAIPSELVESELFGHKRGAFTGAIADKVGLLELADGGSLFLDEIGEMPANLQVKLLRVLQEREFRPVGDTRVVKTNFRLICATNIDVDAALADKRLRPDLYFRINTILLPLPPLRERPEDIPLLASHFLQQYASRHGRPARVISDAALRILQRHRWPGNVRELEHAIERAVIVATGTEVLPEDLPEELHQRPRAAEQAAMSIPPFHTLEEIERMAILQTLERTQWNKCATANILGLYRPTLYNKLRKYNLLHPPGGGAKSRERVRKNG